MASPSSVNTHESDWQYGSWATKRRKQTSISGASKQSPREIGFMREPQNDGSASFLGSSSGIHFIRHVYNAFARRSADLQQTRARDRSSVPGEDDRLQRGAGGYYDTNELWSKEELRPVSNDTFSFEELVHFSRPYFENWHPVFPCLHAPSVLKALEILAHQGLASVSRLDLMVIRCIFSISLADSRQVEPSQSKIEPVPALLVFQTVQHIMEEIQSLLTEPTTLPLLQATFTAQLTLASLLRLNAASRVGGIITRTAFHLGLHRCPGRFACFSAEEVDIRRRLFWSIYSLERYLSQALGTPLSIRDDDIDVCYPDAERHATPTANPSDVQRLRLLCHLARYAKIRGLILELRNKSILHSHAGIVEASHVNGELSQWWNEIYDDVYPLEEPLDQESVPGQTLTPYHRLLLIVLRHEAIISMNRPLLAADRPSPDYKNALQTCIGSSRSLLAALKNYVASKCGAPLTWPSFTWTTWMACLILMYASWEGEFSPPTALKYARMGVSVLENLALRGSSWPETCIEAIRSMESALLSKTSGVRQEHGPHSSDKRLTQTQNQTPREIRRDVTPLDRNSRTFGGDAVLTSSTGLETDMTRGVSSSSRRPLLETPNDPAIQGVDVEGQYQSSVISPHDDQINEFQASAGLIFGNMVNTNAPFYPGIGGEEYLPFSDSSFLNDFWSVADGPWMIDGNLL